MTLKLFDIKEYLTEKGIKFSGSGKNVSSGWIGIRCLWCSDKSDHLGINLQAKTFNCFICGKKGIATQIVQKLEGCDWAEAQRITGKYVDTSIRKQPVIERPSYFKMPADVLPAPLPKAFADYLERRGFPVQETVSKHKLHYAVKGLYKFRICIPIIMHGFIVGLTARHIGENGRRYLESPKKDVAVDPSMWIHNYDSIVNGRVLIVEGAFDDMKLGDEVVSGLGTEWGFSRIRELLKKDLKYAGVLFDPAKEAQKKAESLCGTLSSFVPKVELLSMEELGIEDPGALTMKEAFELKREVFG